jgi:hypothetical protein
VESIASGARQSTYAQSRGTPAPLFEQLPLELTIRGGYNDVIRAVRELNAGDVAAQINLASLSDAARRPGERPQLNAAFHVLLLREADESTTHAVHQH